MLARIFRLGSENSNQAGRIALAAVAAAFLLMRVVPSSYIGVSRVLIKSQEIDSCMTKLFMHAADCTYLRYRMDSITETEKAVSLVHGIAMKTLFLCDFEYPILAQPFDPTSGLVADGQGVSSGAETRVVEKMNRFWGCPQLPPR
eukprot:IDg1446t1